MLEATQRAVDTFVGREGANEERLELLRALSDSLEPDQLVDALSQVGAQLVLLDHMEDYEPGREASIV